MGVGQLSNITSQRVQSEDVFQNKEEYFVFIVLALYLEGDMLCFGKKVVKTVVSSGKR